MKRNLLFLEIRSFLKITIFSLFFVFSGFTQIFGQTTGDYRSRQNGNWGTAGTWERYNGTNWVTATVAPTSANANVIAVRSPNTVIVTTNVAVDQVVVESGGQVTVNSGRTLTIANGTGTDMTVNGTLQTNSTSNTSGITTTGTLVFNSGGTYIHNVNGEGIPTATWDVNSNCLVTGVVATLPGGRNQNFGNLIWNNTAQTATTAYGALSITGNLTIQSTGSGQFNFTNATANTVGGDFIQTGGTVRLANTGATSLTVGGNFSLSGGTFNLSYGTGVGTLNVAGNFTHTGGTITESSSGSGAIVFNGSSLQTYISGGTVSNTINFTVNSGVYLQMAAPETIISGGGTFTLSSNATLGITSSTGITSSGVTGNIQVSGTRTFNSGANYIYNGTSAQNTGNGLPATVSNLTFDNSGGAITFNSERNITDNFTIASGSVANLGTYTHTAGDLTLGVEGTISGSWGSSSSTATYKNDTFFAPTTGIINVTNSKCGVVTAPTGISASPANICVGESSTIAINNPGAGFTTDWFTGSCGGVLVGTGNSLSVSPTVTTTYYARTRNTTTGCFSVSCANVTVTVIPPVPDFDATITDATCPSYADGSIEITNPIPIQFNDPDYIDIVSNLLSNRNAFTLEGWIKVDLNDIGTRISLFGQNDAIEFGFMSSSSLTCWTASGGSVSANNYPSDNGWHHVAAVGNGTNIILYIDGEQVAIGGNATNNYGNNTSYSSKIGAGVWDPTGGHFPGQMLKVGFWNSALDATQISNLASGYYQYTGSETGLLAGYNFFEGTGTILGSEISGTEGIFNGTPAWTDIYTYSWTKTGEPGFSATAKNIAALTTGEYNLTVSNGSCNRANSFTVNSTLSAFTSGAILTTGETICNGGNPAIIGSSTASSGGDNSITYEWRANGTPIASTNSATYDPPTGLTTTTTYTRWAKDETCNTTFTQSTGSWVVTVNPRPSITTQPSDLTLCEGESGSFNVATSASSPTYQWGYATSPTPASWIDIPEGVGISGSQTAELDLVNIPVVYNGFFVSCLITANGCESRSSTVLLTVNPLPTTGEIIPD
jgi:hypothetical protein